MTGRSLYYEAGPGEWYAVQVGDHWHFDVVPERKVSDRDPCVRYPTRLAAIEAHITILEVERATLNGAIARAKRLRRSWSKP